MELDRVHEDAKLILRELGRVVVGYEREARIVLAALISGGNVLLEGVPGLAKTTLVKALARLMGLVGFEEEIGGVPFRGFTRIQFTPDLLPSDVTGSLVWNPREARFEPQLGPVFAYMVLADEINRASPRTQSALLEAMQERQVTIEGNTLPLPEPFLVIATQNPIELEGTFPLPEAQIDRFLVKVTIPMPGREVLRRILRGLETIERWPVEPVASRDEILEARRAIWRVEVSDPVVDYIIDLVEETHRHPDVRLGASPRAAIALQQLARALAALEGRGYVIPDDVKTAARYVLVHRVILRPEAEAEGRRPEDVVESILSSVRVPVP